MNNNGVQRAALATSCVLLVPLAGNVFLGWQWPAYAFAAWGAVLFGAGLAYEHVARKGGTTAYRLAVGVAVATGFVLVYINAAAGIIGDGPVNLLYLGVLAVGGVGALVAQFRPQGMALALAATAAAQMLVPAVALAIWKSGGAGLLADPNSPHPPFHPGVGPVFLLNGGFALAWLASAVLFRRGASAWGEAAPYQVD
jgi:hypothetical protein